jgi:signal peptidase I
MKNNKMNNKLKKLRDVWNFLWNGNSIWSWIFNIVVAFLLIKFVFYPGIGLLLKTDYPIVAVVSESMEHGQSFDSWWNSDADCGYICKQSDFYAIYNITSEDFQKFNFKNGFNKGDLIIVIGKKPEQIKVGDVIVFMGYVRDKRAPIIHRVIKKFYNENVNQYYFQTKGDHNTRSLYSEMQISKQDILGVGIFRIPYLGYVKLWFVDFLIRIGVVRADEVLS